MLDVLARNQILCRMGMLPSRSKIDVMLIPDALKRRIHQNIERYSILLLANEELCGTGTLVVVDGIHGILTAGHVAEVLQNPAATASSTMLGTIWTPAVQSRCENRLRISDVT